MSLEQIRNDILKEIEHSNFDLDKALYDGNLDDALEAIKTGIAGKLKFKIIEKFIFTKDIKDLKKVKRIYTDRLLFTNLIEKESDIIKHKATIQIIDLILTELGELE